MPDEVREHLTRDQRLFLHPESLQILQIHSSIVGASSNRFYHFLQGSGQRTGMAIAEAWFCAQWPIFVLFLLLYGWKIQTWPIISFLLCLFVFLIFAFIFTFSRYFYPKRLSVLTFMVSSLDINGCVKLFWGDSKCTLLYKLYTVYSLLYIVAKCHFFSVVTWKDIIKYLQKCEGRYCMYVCKYIYMYTQAIHKHR